MGIKAFHKRRAAHSKKKKRKEKEEQKLLQVITKTEYKSKTLYMAFIIARFVERSRGREGKRERGHSRCIWLDNWTQGHNCD